MKYLYIGLLLFTSNSFIFGQQNKNDSIAFIYQNTITAKELKQHLYVIADDSFAGRSTGAKGQKMAASYLSNQMKISGILPGVINEKDSSYFQKFQLELKTWGDVFIQTKEQKYEFLKDFYAYGDVGVPESCSKEVIFTGYGIDSPSYSDYKNINGDYFTDVKGKIVLFFAGEPYLNGKSLVSKSATNSEWANDWRKKAKTALGMGANNVFIIVGEVESDFNQKLARLKHHLASPTMGFTHKRNTNSAYFLSTKMAAEILNTTEDKLIKIRDERAIQIHNHKYHFNPKKEQCQIIIKTTFNVQKIDTENVIGLIPGTDKKDEFVFLTAHYDHIGMEGEEVYNGADDDGSGTVALLEIGEAFAIAANAGFAPRRTVVIMPVTGEEKGLLGSEYYTDKPVFPLEKTIVDLNIDMIGRLDEFHENDPNYVYIIGSDRLSDDLHLLNEKVNNKTVNLKLDYKYNSFDDPNRFYFRSDHYNFAKNNIPVIFYFNGTHEDYHQPTDTVDKIDFDKIEKISQLIFRTAWEIANREEPLKLK